MVHRYSPPRKSARKEWLNPSAEYKEADRNVGLLLAASLLGVALAHLALSLEPSLRPR